MQRNLFSKHLFDAHPMAYMHALNINVSRALIKIHLYYMSAPDFCELVEIPTDQSKSPKIACFHGNKRLDQSEH